MHMDRDINRVINELRRDFPEIAYEQLQVEHPGFDDDGLWFFTHPQYVGEVQLESWNGMVPFIVESTNSHARDTARTVEEAVELVLKRLNFRGSTG
jgi:hypothetical protein